MYVRLITRGSMTWNRTMISKPSQQKKQVRELRNRSREFFALLREFFCLHDGQQRDQHRRMG